MLGLTDEATVVVVAGLMMATDWLTAGAGLKFALPAWEAVIEHVPGAPMVAAAPDTVHTEEVIEANDTVSPDVAVAASATVALGLNV